MKANLVSPINFQKWINDNRAKLKPPVCNQVVWEDGDFIIMVVGGPNQRKDYHVNQTPEFFYQIEGDMVLKIVNGQEFSDVLIKEGEIYLLPPNIPHSPQRFENTVGMVVEQRRPKGMMDGLVWFCESCGSKLGTEAFEMKDIVNQLPMAFKEFYGNVEKCTCEKCGAVMEEK